MNAKTKREKGHQRKNSEKIEIACVCRPFIWLGKVRKTSYGLPCTEDDSFIISNQQTCFGALSTRVRPTVVSNSVRRPYDSWPDRATKRNRAERKCVFRWLFLDLDKTIGDEVVRANSCHFLSKAIYSPVGRLWPESGR